MEIRQQLFALQDEKYQQFSQGLIPTVDNIIGVRLPLLRKLAQSIAKEEGQAFLAKAQGDYFEEVMLEGMVIGYLSVDFKTSLELVREFVPKIDNWSVCDSFSGGLKFIKKDLKAGWEFLAPYFTAEGEFEVRFGVVMLLNYYISPEYIWQVLAALERVEHEGYYAKMAVAWAVASCYRKMPEETLTFLKDNNLDLFVHNTAIQKICQSQRIDAENRELIAGLKRK